MEDGVRREIEGWDRVTCDDFLEIFFKHLPGRGDW